jgi:Xaa-Pro aminopeptidase
MSIAPLLEASGLDWREDEVVALIRGVLAAPQALHVDAWLDLIAPPDASELRAGLCALKAELAPRPGREPPVAERLTRVRDALAERGVDGMILPLTDEHRSEYIPASAMRLAWLTGFTGSAGTVAVLPERAALFVDGRYTIQAAAELDPALFERCHVIDQPPASWLGEHLGRGQRLGFDPQLHVKAEVERYRRACAKAGAELIALDDNPIDAVWASRPPPPIAPITLQGDAYAGESCADKRARIGAAVGKAGAEVAVLSAPDSIAWLLNLRGGDIPFNPVTLRLRTPISWPQP